ncbi:MAG: cation diffusion facilitator family transporter [Acidimicrobiales bacterium]
MSAKGGTRAIIAAFLANLGIAVAKFIGFLLTGSASMLSESIHSTADAGNQGLLMLGHRRARRAPDDEHPFGYARERYFWSFVVALVLFSLGSLFSLFEGFDKVRHPHEIDSVGVAFVILGVAILLEAYSFRTAIHEARPHKGNASWRHYIRHAREPELPVVLLEDLGALIGLVLAFSALIVAEVTNDAVWDGIGTLCIGVLLGIIAIVLAIEMKGLLIGESATRDNVRLIEDAIVGSMDVLQLIHLRTQHLGPEELLVGAKIQFRDGLDMAGLARAIDDTEARIRAVVPIARPMYIEPDIFHPPLG